MTSYVTLMPVSQSKYSLRSRVAAVPNCLVIAVALLAGLHQASGDAVPDILVRAHHQRCNFKTARFRYVTECEFPGVLARTKTRYEARVSGGDIAWTDFGDDDGIVLKDPLSGTPQLGVLSACSYRQTIRNRDSGVEWSRMEGRNGIARLRLRNGSPMLSDPRSFGLRTRDPRDTSPEDLCNELLAGHAEWKVGADGGLKTVAMRTPPFSETDRRRLELLWWIDPERDGAIVATEKVIIQPGSARERLAKSKTDYQFVDGRWWPTYFETYSPKTGHTMKVTFESAEFDRPEHEQRLSPDIWGVPPGVLVYSSFDPLNADAEQTHVHYMGDGLTITQDAWQALDADSYYPELLAYWEYQGGIGRGRFPKWWNDDDADFGLASSWCDPDLWEAYVRRWIMRHNGVQFSKGKQTQSKLTQEQITAAWAILKDCRRRAEPILRRTSPSALHQVAHGAREAAASKTDVPPVLLAQGRAENSQDSSRFREPSWAPRNTLAESVSGAAESTVRGTPDERELKRLFELLKRRLSQLLEREQLVPHEDAEQLHRKD